ncbi:hypothetical protein ABPG72_019112 [Tetrahymena utriculariae]
MDQTQFYQTQVCQIHTKKKIKYLQVKQPTNNQIHNIFLCDESFNEDFESKSKDILKISQIVEDGEKQIISKQPPLEDQQITKKLKQQIESIESSNSILKNINDYFIFLKDELMGYLLQKISFQNNINKYHRFSNQDKSFYKAKCLLLIHRTQRFQQIICINLSGFIQILITDTHQIKQQIISYIDEIKFFNEQYININLDSSSISNAPSTSCSDKLMQLISNKSNFCSDPFLKQVKDILDKMNPFLEKIQFENLYFQNNQPTQFSKNQINLDQLFSSSEKFNLFNQLQESGADDLINLLKKRVQFQGKKIYEKRIYYNESFQRLFINKNCSKQIEIKDDQSNYFRNFKDFDISCVLQNILERQKKYIFRIKCDVSQPIIQFDIGLIQNDNIDKVQGYAMELIRQLKEKIFYVVSNSVFELRVWIGGQKLEILDYPNQQNKIELVDENKQYLDSYKDLRIYLYLLNQLINYELTKAYTVEQFDL